MRSFIRKPIGLAVILAASPMTGFSAALEEIIVTSQYRAESLQNIAASVSAISGDKLNEASLNKIEDLQAYVPNFTLSETGIGTNLYIRGIGSGINQGFEQSVGMFVDGVYYGRAQLSRAPFLDLERVEVLRGSQNILYGKNSIAGALNIVTAKPSDDFETKFSLLYEPNYDERMVDVVVSVPISESFKARLAYRNRQTGGYVDNIDNGDEPERDEQTLRLSMAWALTDNLDALLKIEHGQFDVKGRQIEIVGDQASLNPALGGLNWSQLLHLYGAPASVLDTRFNAKRSSNGDFSDNTTDTLSLLLNYNVNDYTISSITSHLTYEYDELCDCDFTSADLFTVRSKEDFTQWSQEIRIVSPANQTLDWIAGVYYQHNDIDFEDAFSTSQTSLLIPVLNTVLASKYQSFYPVNAAGQLAGFSVPRTFDQESDVYSAFVQMTWNVADDFRATVGGRYSDEKKTASRVLRAEYTSGAALPYNDTFIPATTMGIDYLLAAVFKVSRHDLSGSRDQQNFSPLVSVEYDINPQNLAYISWTKGYKSGGYDVRSNAPPQQTSIVNPYSALLNITLAKGAFEYDQEKAESIEVGLKSQLNDGAAELNIAYFYTQFDDLQVSVYDGVLGFNVGNAARAISQGLELDSRWSLTDSLRLNASLAWLDVEFTDYPNGQCTQQQRIMTVGLCQADFKGKTNQYVADWSAMFALEYDYLLSDTLQLHSMLDIIFTDAYNPSQNIDPGIEQAGYHKVNARIALSSTESQWELAVIAKNLGDRKIITYANDTPLSANLAASVGYYALTEPGRTVALQFSYHF